MNKAVAYLSGAGLWALMALIVVRYTLGDSSWGQDGVVMAACAVIGARTTGRHLARMSGDDDE